MGFVRPNCRPPMKVGGEKRAKDACILRQPRPGDMGWVVHRHGVVGREESSGPRIRHSFREPVHTVLTSGWLPEDYLIDRKPPSGGSTHLPESRFSTGPRGTATQLRA